MLPRQQAVLNLAGFPLSCFCVLLNCSYFSGFMLIMDPELLMKTHYLLLQILHLNSSSTRNCPIHLVFVHSLNCYQQLIYLDLGQLQGVETLKSYNLDLRPYLISTMRTEPEAPAHKVREASSELAGIFSAKLQCRPCDTELKTLFLFYLKPV